MAALISNVGAEVTATHSAEHAEQLILSQRFDGIFLDLMMPRLDGFELSRRIRASAWNRRTPIVAVSGREDADTMRRAFEAGSNFYLKKPVDRRKLVQLFTAVRGPMIDNRRRFARLSLRTRVECDSGEGTFMGESHNISEGGKLLEPARPLNLGTRLRLAFHLPTHVPKVYTVAVVERVDTKSRVGVSFVGMARTDAEKIRELVSEAGEHRPTHQ